MFPWVKLISIRNSKRFEFRDLTRAGGAVPKLWNNAVTAHTCVEAIAPAAPTGSGWHTAKGSYLVNMFALDEELVRWQAELSEAHGSSRLPRLTALAWHLRQRDPLRAQTLSAEIAPLLAMLPVAEA